MKNKKPEHWKWFVKFWNESKKYILIAVAVIIISAIILGAILTAKTELSYDEFKTAAQNRKIEKITIQAQGNNMYKITGKFINTVDLREYATKKRGFNLIIRKEAKLENLELEDFFKKYNIKFIIKGDGGGIIPYIIGAIFIFIAYRFFKHGVHGHEYNEYTKASIKFAGTKIPKEARDKVTFKDVAGLEEAKEELKEVIDFLKDPARFSRLGARVPRGVILIGGPGTGKTLLARAVANEANATFLYMSGSAFVELYVGVGASRVRDLFKTGKKHAPCLIFIDELDAVGKHRGASLEGGHGEREQTLNQLLVEMDGFEQEQGIFLIAATNRPDILDKALLRPGRFDRKVYTNLPDIEDRLAILKVHTKEKPLAKKGDLKIIARGTPGFSGADLANVANEAALRAARKKKNQIEMEDFEWAKEKILLGAEKKIIITDEEKRAIAYHEAGHALVNLFCPEADPLHKISVMPRGQVLGVTVQLPHKDKHIHSKKELKARLTVLMGGRAADEMFLKQQTTGATNDIKTATGIAREMVCDYGMSNLGPVSFGLKENEVFLDKELVRRQQNYSEDTARKIDKAVKALIDRAGEKAKGILKDNKYKVNKLVKVLLEKETLSGKDVRKILKIKKAAH